MTSDELLFLRVVESGSLKAAADQLGTDPSTVSRRLAALETRLGVTLVRRSTRRTTPTDAGARYYQGLQRILEDQARLEAEIAGVAEVPRGFLRVTAPVDFGARFVVPVLDRLQRRAPDLEVELLLGSGFYDLREQGIDVAIRIGRLEDSALTARKLGQVPRVLVGSRAYLEERGWPRVPSDLESHDFVFYTRSRAKASLTLRGPDGAVHEVRVSSRITVNSVSAIRVLVEAGRGLHLGPVWAFRDGLDDGRLCAVLPDHALDAYPLHAVFGPGPLVPAKVRAFVDLMAESWDGFVHGAQP